MDLTTLEEMVLANSGQNCATIALELKTHADNAKHGHYCYISITSIFAWCPGPDIWCRRADSNRHVVASINKRDSIPDALTKPPKLHLLNEASVVIP